MAFTPNFVDLVRNYTTTSGTDDFVLGPAVNGFTGFGDACAVGDCFYYSALGVDNPGDTEVGRGTLMAGGVISRDPISDKKTNFKTGTKSISLIAAAEWFGQANALVGGMSPVGQALVSAPSAREARAALELGDIPVDPMWYGLIEGDDEHHGPANSAAFAAMLSDMAASRQYRIAVPAGVYWFADTIDINIGNLIIEGSSGGGTDVFSTQLRFSAGKTGIRVQNELSSGADTLDSTQHSSGKGVLIRNIGLFGFYHGAEAEAHGIQLRTQATLENVCIFNFEGDGIHAAASSASASGANPPYGNTCASLFTRVTVIGCRDGIFFDGSDSNATTVVQPSIMGCRRWGIWDSSVLGNTYIGGNLAANGITPANDGVAIGATEVSFNGNIYAAIVGQEAWCSANAPSGTTASNQGWYYVRGGGPSAGVPAWSGGILVRAGGCIHDDSDAATSYYAGIYAEADQGKAQLSGGSLVVGGKLADWCYHGPSLFQPGNVLHAAAYGPNSFGGAVTAEEAFQTVSGKVFSALGFPQNNTLNIAFNMMHSTLCTQGYQLQFISPNTGSDCDIRFAFAGGGPGLDVYWVTTPLTAQSFGTGSFVPHAFSPMKLMVQDAASSPANARRLMIDAAPPATGAHGQGEWCFYRGADPGLIGWKCTAAGTPGTWEAVHSGYGTGPVGYAAGAGGAVAQTTSKSTAVTLNKLCGQITMNAAVLDSNAAVWFTVNNSEVAATDAIELALASGHATPGTYAYQVDGVAAGSFVILVRNVSGAPLGEALVFNFAVKKAVAA